MAEEAAPKIKLEPYQVVLHPLVTEKGTHISERHNAYTFSVATMATKSEIKAAVEELWSVRVLKRADPEPQGQDAATPSEGGPHVRLEKGDRRTQSRRPDRVLLSESVRTAAMAIRNYKPTSPGRRAGSVSDFAEITDRKKEPEKLLSFRMQEEGRPQLPGPHHRSAPGRRPQEDLPDDRLRPEQGRSSREGRLHRIRSEPLGPHRPVALRRRRKTLHPRSRRTQGRRQGPKRSRTSSPTSATACRSKRFRPARRCTASKCSRAAAASCAARPACTRSSTPARESGRRSRFLRAKCGGSPARAGRRSESSATRTTSTCRSARPAASGGWVAGRTFAAWR